MAAAVGSLMMRKTFMPEMVPASYRRAEKRPALISNPNELLLSLAHCTDHAGHRSERLSWLEQRETNWSWRYLHKETQVYCLSPTEFTSVIGQKSRELVFITGCKNCKIGDLHVLKHTTRLNPIKIPNLSETFSWFQMAMFGLVSRDLVE